MKFKSSLVGFILILLTTATAYSQIDKEILSIETFSSAKQAPVGSSFKIAIRINIKPQYHINSNQPLDPAFVPTEVNFIPINGITYGDIYYPQAKFKSFAFSEDELAVYENTVTIYSIVTLSKDFQPDRIHLKGSFSYQACNDENCFLPQQEQFDISVKIVGQNEPTSLINEDVFENFPQKDEILTSKEIDKASLQLTSDELRVKEIIEKGLIYAIAAFFIFGLALNLTPCVYPVIPITVSYFSAQSDKQKGKTFISAFVYVVGIAIIFSFLGLISGLAGKQWGFLFQNPWFVIVITVIILAMAASMFGAFEIAVPAALMNKFGRAREGVIGSLIMGLTVGVVIAPCAAGIIIGLVGLVAKLGIVTKGTILFFIMGLGLGLPYLILASFSGLLNRLPQSGVWMVWIKKFFGILLVGVALYFFIPQAQRLNDMQGFFFGILAIFGGLLLGFLDKSAGYEKGFKIARAGFGIVLILFGINLTNNAIHYQPAKIDWQHYSNQTIGEFSGNGKPVFLDFYADWCAPCKEMDRNTFPDSRIVEMAKNFVMVKIDCTSPDENTHLFMNQFNVTGMPTYIFIDENGNEIKELREIGFVEADDFIIKMQKAQKKQLPINRRK